MGKGAWGRGGVGEGEFGWDLATISNKPTPLLFSPSEKSENKKNVLETSLFRAWSTENTVFLGGFLE